MSYSQEPSQSEPGLPPRVGLRPTRDVRLVEREGRIVAFPGPHHTPVLPRGWAPLGREHQDAVLAACDAAPDALIVRIGSLWEPASEYRVYRLSNELWVGLSIATQASSDTGGYHDLRNRLLLGLAWEMPRAVGIALDFFNWDLEAHGQGWRLELSTAAQVG